MVAHLRRAAPQAEKHAASLIAISEEQGFPQWLAFATGVSGWVLAERQERGNGVSQIRKALSNLQAADVKFFRPYIVSMAAEAYAGCHQGEEGLSALTEALASVDLGAAEWAEIDDVRVEHHEYGSVKLLPGSHDIKWGKTFAVSFLIDWRMWAPYEHSAIVTLEAGHTYILQTDRTTGPGYRVYFWIEDAATGNVVHGSRKP